jgi:hypothetical protein
MDGGNAGSVNLAGSVNSAVCRFGAGDCALRRDFIVYSLAVISQGLAGVSNALCLAGWLLKVV